MSTIMPSARLAVWTTRLGNIADQVQSLIHDRDTWHTISEIGAANPTVVADPFVMGHFNTLHYRRALSRDGAFHCAEELPPDCMPFNRTMDSTPASS